MISPSAKASIPTVIASGSRYAGAYFVKENVGGDDTVCIRQEG